MCRAFGVHFFWPTLYIDDRPATGDQRPTIDRPTSHLGKFQMAIPAQGVVRSTSCLVLGWGFRGRQIEWRYFELDQIQMREKTMREECN